MKIIVAADWRNAIGYKNKLLYNIKADMRRFREMTTGGIVIMGRKTFESLPNGALPDRTNVVITRDPDYKCPGCVKYDSLIKAVDAYRSQDDDNLYIIGGASVYRQAMSLMEPGDSIHMTRIDARAEEADAFFPKIDMNEFAARETEWFTDQGSGYNYRYVYYIKKLPVNCNIGDSKKVDHRIFLSMPFSGQEDTIMQRLKAAEEFVRGYLSDKNAGVRYTTVTQKSIGEIISSGESYEGVSYADEMIDDIREISRCNAILMCKGWENSKGCRFEFEAAKLFNIRIFYQN